MTEDYIKKTLSEIQGALGGTSVISSGRKMSKRNKYIALGGVLVIMILLVVNWRGGGNNVATLPTSTPPTAATASALVSANVQFDEVIPVDKGLPDIHLTSALVKELGAQDPLFVYRPRARWPIASISKLMTAELSMDELDPATIIEVSKGAVDTDGTAGDLKVGGKYTVNDLVKVMLTVSSNDAAVALAEAYDRKQLGDAAFSQALNKTALFVELMQKKAKDLGMEDTYFGDPSGLSMINQSVVGDLDLLLNDLANRHPELLETTRQLKTRIVERTRMAASTFANINQYAGQKDFLGGKTGFTDEAGQNLISLFNYNGKKYEITVLGSEDRFGDTTKLYDWLKGTLPKPVAVPVKK